MQQFTIEQFTLWILDLLKNIVPVLLTGWFLWSQRRADKRNTEADTAGKWADLADQATDQLMECKEEHAKAKRKAERLQEQINKLKRKKK